MTFLEKVQLIERVDQLIRMKATGSAEDLSDRIGVSRSTVYELIDCMRAMGAEIEYCRHRQSFYYLEEKILAIGFVNKRKIRGGRDIFYSLSECPGFSDKRSIYLC
jgi:biotin operon repressor